MTIESDTPIEFAREQNRPLLSGRLWLGEFVFHRAALLELNELVTKAKDEEIDANKVIQYISPGGREPMGGSSVTAFGLGHEIDQILRMIEDSNLAGFARKKELPLVQRVSQAYEDILNAAGMPDPHIARRNEAGRLEHLPFQKILETQTNDPIKSYTEAVDKLYGYFENLFDPKAVIEYCQRRIDSTQRYLDGGMNVRINKPLTPPEIESQTKLIEGLKQAVERNRQRK